MSGFEIAGIVLGSVPLLISALEHYADGIRTIKSIIGYKALVENLALDFRIVNSSYRRGCERLLVRLPLEPEEINQLLQDPKCSQWTDPNLDRQLQRLLGEDYAVYKRLISRIFQRLDKFANKLGLRDDFQPKWISRNGVEKPGSRERFFQKSTGSWKAIMLGFDREEYATDIANIELDVNRISSLVGDVVELEAPRRERNRSANNTRFWQLIRQYAANLFASINWKCNCAMDHTVNLRLQPRRKIDTEDDLEAAYHFLVLFSLSPVGNSDPKWAWRQAQIKPSEIPQIPPPTRSVSFAGPSAVQTTASKIASLCQALRTAPQTPSCIGFLDYQQCRHHIYSSCQDDKRTIISLDQVLRAKNNTRQASYMQRYNYGIKERYQLSVTLASTVLQLHATPWLHTAWNKSDIYFIKGNEVSFADHLYVRKPAVSPQQVLEASRTPGWSNPSLFALAVVLLELYFGCPLESIPYNPTDLDPQGKPHLFTEYLKVNRLADSIDKGVRELESSYFTAIDRCLRCNFDTKTLDLEDTRLQELFYLDVIAPLERSYESMMS